MLHSNRVFEIQQNQKTPALEVLESLFDKSSSPVSPLNVEELSDELTELDQRNYEELVTIELTPEQTAQILAPAQVFPKQETVTALHWHPEFVPMEIIRKRINATFPNKKRELIIPTQHNEILSYDGEYSGVEVDCYAPQFQKKVQFLLHFENSKVEKADVLKSMCKHTRNYRSSQLFELMDSIIAPRFENRLQAAITATAADDDLVQFVQWGTRKLNKLFHENESVTPVEHIKNKLLANYFDLMRKNFDGRLINRAQSFIRAVKKIVKREFSPEYFFRAEEFIEETRSLGGGIIIPHPEQFWPILLAEYDVDGYEVWNPQSRQYTDFLITVVTNQNKALNGRRKLLITMGDDCHMGEKVRAPDAQNKEKAGRQIGVQLAWDDLHIRKSLNLANTDRAKLIDDYKERLN